MTELIDLIWGDDAPASALNVIHKYIGALRRLLEPTLVPRGSGAYLRRRGDGYVFLAGPEALDLVAFRRLVEGAKTAASERHDETALDRYAEALSLWRGPAGDGFPHGSAAMPVFAALDSEFFDACVAAARLAVALGRPQPVLPALHLAASTAPLHEPVQAALISALGAAGQQAQALSQFRTVRTRLAEQLGIDPGAELLGAHRQVLTRSGAFEVAGTGLVGRTGELAVLRQTVRSALAGGTGIAVVEGEPGVGKTRLLEEAGDEARRQGAYVVWCSGLEGEGTPSMWPWVEAIGKILAALPPAARDEWLGGELGRLVEPRDDYLVAPALPDTSGQFRLFEHVVAVVGRASAQRPVVLVVDDLQWAGVASLQMFRHLAARLPAGTTVIGALRNRAPMPGSELSRTLAVASPAPGHRRIRLGPLDLSEVAELVHRETGRRPGSEAAAHIHARTSGNPFLVRELSRFLAGGGVLTEDATAPAAVPTTVHDILRVRTAGLGGDAKSLLQIAALVGRDVGLSLLARTADLDIQACLDRLEPLAALGLLEPAPGDPFSFRFAHDLVREAAVGTLPARSATRLHLRIATALEQGGSDQESVAERLAYHLWAAGPLADPARTAEALVRAGRRAATKSAFGAAEWQLQSAVKVARTAGLAELELYALSLLSTVFWRQRATAAPTSSCWSAPSTWPAGSAGRRRRPTFSSPG